MSLPTTRKRTRGCWLTRGRAILLREQDCGEHTLYDTVELLMQERDRRDAMVRALNAMAVPNAGEKIYQTLREIMRDKA